MKDSYVVFRCLQSCQRQTVAKHIQLTKKKKCFKNNKQNTTL